MIYGQDHIWWIWNFYESYITKKIASIMYNCYHIKLMKCRLHNYDYINKELNFWWWYFLHSTHTKQKLQYKMEIKAEYTYIQKDIW
jgi:hypothetical protein